MDNANTRQRTVSRFREVLPQVLAMAAVNCTIMDMSITIFLSTVVIGDLHNNKNDTLSMNDSQVSWFGSLPYMTQPMGSIASGFLVSWFGRKRSLLLVCLPYMASCLMMSTAPSVTVLLLTNAIVGVTVGLTEAPTNSYFGEICQPELRGILAGSAAIFYQFGMFLEQIFGTLMDWRTAAGVTAVIPILTFIFVSQIPDSPIWLIAQGRKKDAEAALCWLRGWVEPSAVQKELESLVSYHENVTMSSIRRIINSPNYTEMQPVVENSHDKSLLTQEEKNENESNDRKTATAYIVATRNENNTMNNEVKSGYNKWSLLLEPETFRPLVLTLLFFAFSGMGGVFSIRPYQIEVLNRFKVSLEGKWSSALVTLAGFLGSITMVATVNVVGQRKLALLSTSVIGTSSIILGTYAFIFIDESTTSWIPLALFVPLYFASAIQCQLPWLLVSEAFPFRTRGLASGISAAAMYTVAFVASKSYLTMEHTLKMYGTFWFFSIVNIICFTYLYFELPETEGKTLEEIEQIFKARSSRRK